MWSHNVHGIGMTHYIAVRWYEWVGHQDTASITRGVMMLLVWRSVTCDAWQAGTVMTAPISRIPPSPGPGHSVHSVHHSGRAGPVDASGEVTSPYCTPPGTQSFVSRYHLHTLELSHGAFYTDTHLFHCGSGEQRTVVVSPICPRHQDDGVTPLVDTGQWWHHGPSPGPGLGSWRVSFYY